MAKVRTGRLSGRDGMNPHPAAQLYVWSEELEASASDLGTPDDPRWLRRWAGKMRQLADKKVKARVHKVLGRRRQPRIPKADM